MKTKIMTLIVAGLVLCGCSSNHEIEETDYRMNLDFRYPGTTKANDNGFVGGDSVGVYVVEYENDSPGLLQISGNHTNNAMMIYNGSLWVAKKTIYQSEKVTDVYAYYPFIKPNAIDECLFTIHTDQSIDASAYEKSDFLWAKESGVPAQSDRVSLQFAHRMSKLNVVLQKGVDYEGVLPEDAVVKLHSTVPTAWIDLSTGMPAKNPNGTPKTITCRKMAVDRFSAIVVPQSINSIRPFVEVIMGGVSYMVESTFTFRPGVVYTYTLTVNAAPDKILIDIGGQIENNWN